MRTGHQFERYGLFRSSVPRYTSYPPANHFEAHAGAVYQQDWLSAISDDDEISLYVHIPFCRRLCWFCACRTQGTQNRDVVDRYVDDLLLEIDLIRDHLPDGIKLSRLHLGGGTPTILAAETLHRLLTRIFVRFGQSEGFEFSAEVDPTDAPEPVLKTLADAGLTRASVGVQDFDLTVQNAIGRQQSFDETRRAIDYLRGAGIKSLNVDLIYGLPFQSSESLGETLRLVSTLDPDRIALFGYAHVPWMSKRQVMIDDAKLPTPRERFNLSEQARAFFTKGGYQAIGIDHFARPWDGLALAAMDGSLSRNFQGYTDDGAQTLIGIGASAISKYRQGYVQNASATSDYVDSLRNGYLAGRRGYKLRTVDFVTAAMIEQLMCHFRLDIDALKKAFTQEHDVIDEGVKHLAATFPDLITVKGSILRIDETAIALTRIIVNRLDQFQDQRQAHSLAI